MGIFSWIILGLIAGFIGSKIVNRSGQGFWLDIALLVAVAGSVVVLLLYNLLTSRRAV